MGKGLFYRRMGKGPPIIILHGLFGSSDNWVTIGRKLSDSFDVTLVDLRNHGRSFHHQDFDYKNMANDVKIFLDSQSIGPVTIMGHSMGGKVAMFLAITSPTTIENLIVVDIGPKYYPVHHDQILQGLVSIDINNMGSRREADEQLSQYVKEIWTRQFLLKNLQRTETGFTWQMNLPAISSNIEQVGAALDSSALFEGPALFIRGAQSEYIEDEDWPSIQNQFPMSSLVTIENSGHWVHAENPEAFVAAVQSFLRT